jgi:hypothetical protein
MNREIIKRIKADATRRQRQGETPNRIIIITNKGNGVVYDAKVKGNRWYINEELSCVVLETVVEDLIPGECTHDVQYIDIKEIAMVKFQYNMPEYYEDSKTRRV